MLSFRQKILISNTAVVIFFMVMMFPLADKTVSNVLYKVLESNTIELIDTLQDANDVSEVIEKLKRARFYVFFRVGLLDSKGGLLYDSHIKRFLGKRFIPGHISTPHPEVERALKEGSGFAEGYSQILNQPFTYLAKRFVFHGETFVIRMAFPHDHVKALQRNVKVGFLSVCAGVFLLFSIMIWIIIHHFTRPIHHIIQAVKPYKNNTTELFPSIELPNISPKDDFAALASTLNSLAEKVRNHIKIITEERNEKEAILTTLDEGVVAVDEKMKIQYINTMALSLLDLEGEDVLQEDFSVVGRTLFYDLLVASQKENRKMTSKVTEGRGVKKYFDIVAVPKEDKGAILIIKDKSSDYRMLEMRKDFVANASHELKTPITIIQGFAETLHDNPALPVETNISITKRIVNNCRRMETIVKNLLTLSDIENLPRSRLEYVEIREIIEDCKETVLSVYPDAEITIKSNDEDTRLHVDPDLIEVAIRNLLDNAAKYSPPPAKIEVTIEKEDAYTKISVADKGLGIPEEELSNIFQRFYTINKEKSGSLKSSGLGLSIVETIMEKHFGKVLVESKLYEGTTFTLVIPHFDLGDEDE
jgi:two-component system, OmpR family, phosphate regulon sensor histidine kinase PhoR